MPRLPREREADTLLAAMLHHSLIVRGMVSLRDSATSPGYDLPNYGLGV